MLQRLLLVTVFFGSVASAADDVPESFMLRFNQLVLQAEELEETGGPKAAIRAYEDALHTWGEDYGRIHLRLGVLFLKLGLNPEAAKHFIECQGDKRVDDLDRETICASGFEQVARPMTVEQLPEGGQVVVLEPTIFAGAFKSGDALPLGPLSLVVEAPGYEPNTVEHTHDGQPFVAEPGMQVRKRGSVVPDGFVDGVDETTEPEDSFISDEVDPVETGIRWPAYLSAGVGLAMVGGGITLGMLNRGDLDDIRSRQRDGGCVPGFCASELADAENKALTADVVWMSGAVVAASSIIWWYLFDEAGD